MAIAKLSIDLEARLAGLQAGLDKAGFMAEKQAAQIERAFGGLKKVASGVGVAFAAIIPASLATSFAQFVRSTVDGLDKLNDLADATGASVENLSALENVALRTGTSVDTMADSLVKMNKALADAKPGSDAERAFKALGLSIAELKRLDPVEAFQKLAVALSTYADDGNKARLVQELFGKSMREVAPLLRDVAEAGKLNATVTKAQADEAEKYNKQLYAMQKNSSDLARALVSELLPALNKYLETLNRARSSGASIFGAEMLSEAQSVRLKLAVAKVEDLQAALAKDPGNRGLSEALTRARADADDLLKVATKANDKLRGMVGLTSLPTGPEQSKSAFLRGDKDTSQVPRPSVGDITGGLKEKKVKPPWNLNEWLIDVQKTMDMAFIDANERTNDAAAKDLEKRKEQLAKWADDMRDENLRLTVELVQDEKARAKALILLDEQVQMKRLESLEIYGKAYEDAQALIKQRTELALRGAEQIKDTSKDLGAEIGLVFSSAAGEAITKFGDLRSVLKGILADLEQIAVREIVTKPLTKVLTDSLQGFNIMSLFGSAKGNAFDRGRVVPFANGGVVDRPTLFRFGKGAGLMGEAGPEAILPLQRGRDGKLGVAGGKSVAMTYAPTINIDSRADQAQVGQLVAAAVAQGQQQMLRHLQAQGVVA